MRAYIKAELLKNRHSEWARLMVIFPTISILCSVYFFVWKCSILSDESV